MSGSSIWAEDGWIPLCVVSRGHGTCLGDQVNGYWPVFHRLLAEPLALLPMSLWPWVFPLIGAVLAGIVAAVTFHEMSQLVSRTVALISSLATVCIPFMGLEYLNVVGNLHWSLLMVAMLVLLLVQHDDEVNKSSAAVLFVAGLANPASFVLVLYLGVLAIARLVRRRIALVMGALVLAGWSIQVVMIGLFGGTDRVGTSLTFEEKIVAYSNSLVGIVPGLRVVDNLPVSFLSVSTRLLPELVAVVVVSLLIWLAFDRERVEIVRRFAAFGLATQVLGVFLLLILDENPRYVYVVVALNSLWVLGIIGAYWRPRPLAQAISVVVLALLWVPGFPAGPYRTTPSDVSWSDQLNAAENACAEGAESVEFHFAPERSYETTVACAALFD